jgi:type II secretory pathway pseudopilin PulG
LFRCPEVGSPSHRPAPCRQAGFSLVEALVALTIAVIAVVGLAYNFGNGRALVNRYETARLALGAAQRRMEMLAVLPPAAPEFNLGIHGPTGVVVGGQTLCQETWTVARFDDPINGIDATQFDLKRVEVTITWGQATPAETIELTRLFPVF